MSERSARLVPLLGMWVFLLSEVLFFGGLFLAVAVYAFQHPADFARGTREMKIWWGTANTAILLTSSWTMALAVEAAHAGRTRSTVRLMVITIFLGAIFIAVKGGEYFLHWREGLMPLVNWRTGETRELEMFFVLYFFMTALHALHLFIGIVVVGCYTWRFHREGVARFAATAENLGLYWHFVDIVWLFLFPALYLCGRGL